MKTLIGCLAVLLAICGCKTNEALTPEKGAPVTHKGIALDFGPDAILTDAQVEVVAKLARDSGLPTVKKIYTRRWDRSNYCISALSGDKFTGREFTYSMVPVGYEAWGHQRTKGEKVLRQRGDFWVLQGAVIRWRGATFAMRSGSLRVLLGESTSLQFADKVVAAIEERTPRLRLDKRGQRWFDNFHPDVTRPDFIHQSADGRCRLVSGTVALDCEFDSDGGLTIVGVIPPPIP